MTRHHPPIPELAGVATYADAARVGYSVEENVRRLLRFHWVERRLMATLVAHLPATPEWEVKCALALHQWHCAEHADALRRRIGEMRHPLPPLDVAPAAALDAFLEELLRSRDTVELLAGVYGVAVPALAAAYRRHVEETNPLVDHPTRRLLRLALVDVEDALQWGERALAGCVESNTSARARSDAWQQHLRSYLDAAGGFAGDAGDAGDAGITAPGGPPRVEVSSAGAGDRRRSSARGIETPPLPPPRAAEPFVPDLEPRRDARFRGSYNFNFPPHLVYNAPDVPADERNLALLCKRTLEMDVPEMMASFLTERSGQPWEFYHDYSRQLWDEARHAMMGTVALEARGVDWTEIPLNVGFALRLNLHATPLERQILLYAIEQSLMPGDTGKRFERETAAAAGDALSVHFHDYDWADEVLHAQIGRRLLAREGISSAEAMERAHEVHEKTWAALDRYRDRDPQEDWWPGFVRRVLGRESAVPSEALGELKILAE